MRRSGVARVTGAVILVYLGVKVATAMHFEGSIGSGDAANRLAAVAEHLGDLRFATILGFVSSLCALALGTLLYEYTRASSTVFPMLVVVCRVGEAVLFSVFSLGVVAIVYIAMASTGSGHGVEATLVAILIRTSRHATLAACFFFAIGSLSLAWMLLRERLAPRYIAMLGLIGSLVPALTMPLQVIGALGGFPTGLLWILMFVFEFLFGSWLVTTGGRTRIRGEAV